ncbi:MAG TPA: glycosyltransferase [Candidatus Binatia bacterium]
MSGNGKINATVVVLGDLGRSPRMQYHARSLADLGAEVDLVGYAGSALPESIARHPRIHNHLLPPRPVPALDLIGNSLPSAVSIFRIAVQAMKLFRLLLFGVRRPDLMLLQNPPGIPALAVMLICARLRSARVVVDWHNFGYTVLALKSPPDGMPVRLTRWYERTLGRRADGHLCVSRAMQKELHEGWGLREVEIVYDRPAPAFVPATSEAGQEPSRLIADLLGRNGHGPERRPALLVTSTSWTPDEDFDLLLDALSRVDAAIAERGASSFPELRVVITGEGPLKRFYEEKIAAMRLRRIQIRTAWLTPEDYPVFLRCADLGLCFHRSSSGLDLPMKIADMLGSGLPVLAFDYGPCLAERLRHGENGLIFSGAAELAEQIVCLFKDFPEPALALGSLRRNVARSDERRWEDEWRACAWPALQRCLHAHD